MTEVEWIAAALGIANIVLIVARSVWNYMFGLMMVTLYFFVFLDQHLYSDTLLQLFFLVVQIYGWWHWASVEAEAGEVVVERLSASQRLAWSAGTIALILAWGSFVRTLPSASYPFWDAAVAGLSVAAQILMSRRYVENWLLWILVNIISIGLYAAKHLWPTTGLYIVFLILSVVGYVKWMRAPRGAQPVPATA